MVWSNFTSDLKRTKKSRSSSSSSTTWTSTRSSSLWKPKSMLRSSTRSFAILVSQVQLVIHPWQSRKDWESTRSSRSTSIESWCQPIFSEEVSISKRSMWSSTTTCQPSLTNTSIESEELEDSAPRVSLSHSFLPLTTKRFSTMFKLDSKSKLLTSQPPSTNLGTWTTEHVF